MIPSRLRKRGSENLSHRTIQVLYLPHDGNDAPIRLQPINDGRQFNTTFAEANDCSIEEATRRSGQVFGNYRKISAKADMALFEMGIIHAHPKNRRKIIRNPECFQKLIRDYPESVYRQNSEMMIFNIRNVALKDQTIGAQQMQIETLQHEVQGKEK